MGIRYLPFISILIPFLGSVYCDGFIHLFYDFILSIYSRKTAPIVPDPRIENG